MRPRNIIALLLPLMVPGLCLGAPEFLVSTAGDEVVEIGSGEKAKPYVRIDAEGATFDLSGAGELTGWVRAHYAPGTTGARTVTLHVAGLAGGPQELAFDIAKPSPTPFADGRDGRPSGGVKLTPITVPDGEHRLRLTAPAEPLYVRLLWAPTAPEKAAAAEPKRSAWSTGGNVGLETIYDDNFLRYSDDYLDDFHHGTYPYKFKIDREDTHIFAPHIEVYAQRKFWSPGNTRFRFRFKRWQYVQGNIKSNMAFDFGVRQFFSGGKSLEFGYQYAPQQYIRQLSDRSPLMPPSDPLVWEEFRYTRNVLLLTWRQKLHTNLNLKLVANRSLRYYNQPFMENDIFDLGLRGTVYWTLSRAWRLTLDYGFTYAPARGADEVGESVEVSDNSDPSYERDLYQIDVRWRPAWSKPVFDSVSLRFQHQVYWFTSDKLLNDPYHVGRIDRVYAGQLAFDRKLTRDVGMKLGVRYAQRTVDSPWTGDIAEDKDYDQRRFWIGLTYKL